MSLTINRIGGSGGVSESNAILMAHVPTRSTVTVSKGGVILTPKMWTSGLTADEDVAMFIFSPAQFDSVNPWVITSTDGTDRASDTVLIASNKEYEIELSYNLWLYKNGNRYISITGDWEGNTYAPQSGTQTTPTIEFNNDNMYVTYRNTGMLETVNKVPLADYATLYVKMTVTYNKGGLYIGVRENKTNYESGSRIQIYPTINEESIFSLNIANIISDRYVYLNEWQDGNPTCTTYIHQIWCEK